MEKFDLINFHSINSQKSIRIVGDSHLKEVEMVQKSWGVNKLIKDIREGIFFTPLKIYINPPEKEELIINALANDVFYLKNALYIFFYYCVANLIGFGEAVYEVVFISDKNGNRSFKLELIYPKTVREENGKIIQHVPEDEFKDVELPPERIFFFRLPHELNNKIEKVRNDVLFLEFNPLTLKADKLKFLEAGKPINWNPFFGLNEEMTNAKVIYNLKFQKNVIEIRDFIFKQLNEYIKNISAELGFSAQIKIEELLDEDDISVGDKHPKNLYNKI